VGESVVEGGEAGRLRGDQAEGDLTVPLEHREGAEEMARLAAPAAHDLQVLAVDLTVGVDRAVADVGVVPRDDVAPAHTEQFEPFRDGGGRARRLDDDVSAFAVRGGGDDVAPAGRRGAADVAREVGGPS